MRIEMRSSVACTVFTAWATLAAAQVDDRMARVNEGASPRVFAVDIAPDDAIGLSGPTEVRQERPPHNYALLVRNQGAHIVGAVIVMMAVVLSDGTVKSFQELPAIKNLKPGQERRQEARVRAAVLSPSDRVVFVLRSLTRDGGPPPWHASDDELRAVIKNAARQVPVP